MLKIIISTKRGGFGLSAEAVLYLLNKNSELVHRVSFAEAGFDRTVEPLEQMLMTSREDFLTNWTGAVFDMKNELIYDVHLQSCAVGNGCILAYRTHPDIIEVFEKMGKAASGPFADLKMITIADPDITLADIEIADFNGKESIREKHRTWE